ncbi:MAG: hypothetical protein ACI4PF_07055 [Christensenellales bacterium]
MVITNQSNLTSKYVLPDQTEKDYSTESNISTTENMTESFIKEKSLEKEYVLPGEEVKQTLVLTNNSEYEILSVNIQDTLSEGATFKAGSVEIDGTPYEDFDPATGFELPSGILGDGGTTTVEFIIVVDAEPEVESITDKSTINYQVNEAELTEDTSEVTLNVVVNKITIVKTSNASAVISGQTLTYQNVITNEGSITNTDLFFTDPIPEGTTFVDGSVLIDDVEQPDYDPATGFALDELQSGASVTIKFDVTVN